MFKEDLWCGYCGGKYFEVKRSSWVCTSCGATFEDNPGYGYFTSHWGSNGPNAPERYSSNTGESLNDSMLPRTPEGIVRHSDSREELEEYLESTQIK